MADGFGDVLAGALAPFDPGADAEADADVRAVGDFKRLDLAIVVAEDAARDAGKFGHRRVIRVNSDSDTKLFGHWNNLLDEMRVVLPDLFL